MNGRSGWDNGLVASVQRPVSAMRSMVECKVCGAHFDLVPSGPLFDDDPAELKEPRAGACPVCGATRVYDGADFFDVPAA